MIYIYERISTKKQGFERQDYLIKEFLKSNDINEYSTVQEVVSGKVNPSNREKYSAMCEKLQANDVLIVTDLDRIGRDATSTIAEVTRLKSLGVKLLILDTPYLNDYKLIVEDSNSMYNMIIDILVTLKSHIAQQEREKLSARTKAGMQASDKKAGRPVKTVQDIDKKFIDNYELYKNRKLNITDLARLNGISRKTVYSYINLLES